MLDALGGGSRRLFRGDKSHVPRELTSSEPPAFILPMRNAAVNQGDATANGLRDVLILQIGLRLSNCQAQNSAYSLLKPANKNRATARVAPTISGLAGSFVYGRGDPRGRPGKLSRWESLSLKSVVLDKPAYEIQAVLFC
jgi:hypothetical protein